MTQRPEIILYTDGSSRGNPGPGGYGIVISCGDYEKEMSGGYACTTNNRMELMAVIVGLEAIRWENARVHIFSDSTYVVHAVTEGWLAGWQRKNWKKVKNVDLWQRFLAVYSRHQVEFTWVKGHASNPKNERCDRLAVAAASRADLPADEGFSNTQIQNLDI